MVRTPTIDAKSRYAVRMPGGPVPEHRAQGSIPAAMTADTVFPDGIAIGGTA
jgi:hypothetical protein